MVAAAPVRISDLVLLPELQVRAKTDPGIVKQYAQAMRGGDEFPPIVVAEWKGALLLLDGRHRVAALTMNGERQALAESLEVASLQDAKWYAAVANLKHGHRLKRGEFRGVFRAYVQGHRHRVGDRRGPLKSYREMAGELKMPHSTVRNWMRQDFPSVYAAMGGGDGTAPGGLPEPELPGRMFAREASEALDKAIAALPGVSDPVDRGNLLEKAEALRDAIVAAGVEAEPPF